MAIRRQRAEPDDHRFVITKADADANAIVIRDVNGIAVRLLDEIYMVWSRAQLECQHALRAWLDSGPRNDAAYCAYRAALDREEAAAVDLQRLSQLVAA
jgi:hypothetical protein